MLACLSPPAERRSGAPHPPKAGGLILTPDQLERYLEELARRGRTPGTLISYRHNLLRLYDALPDHKTLLPGDLDRLQREWLAEGYSPRTINSCMSAANGLLDFLDRRDLQSRNKLSVGPERQPELTRAEYLRLLSAARALGKERLYLLVKLFGCTELSVGDLPRLTVESLERPEDSPVRLPEFLRQELLHYAGSRGIVRGPLFQTRDGRPLRRTAVTDSLKQLCRTARVAEEKTNPRCLNRLWQNTQDNIRAQTERLIAQACSQLLETEQLAVGWETEKEVVHET